MSRARADKKEPERARGCGPGSEPQFPRCCHGVGHSLVAVTGRGVIVREHWRVLAGETLPQAGRPTREHAGAAAHFSPGCLNAGPPPPRHRLRGRGGSCSLRGVPGTGGCRAAALAPPPSVSPVVTATHIIKHGPG